MASFGRLSGSAKLPATAERSEQTEKRKITELRIPNSVPSPVDRAEFRFVAVYKAGAERCCINDDIVRARLRKKTDIDDLEAARCDVLH